MRATRVMTIVTPPTAVALAFVALLGGGGAAGDRSPADTGSALGSHPNVVVIMTDDQRYDDLAPMRALRRRVADQGVTFERAFASFPLCCPARASLFTGQYAHNHGVRHNRPPGGGFEAYDDRGSLPVALQRAGYRTGFVGKYLNGYAAAAAKEPEDIPQGWDAWHAQLDGSLFDWRLNSNGTIRELGGRPRDYQTDVYARKAVRFIRQGAARDAPFFLTVVPFAPHRESIAGNRGGPRPAPRHRGAFGDEPLPKMPAFDSSDVSDKPRYVRARPRLGAAERDAVRERHRARLASLLAVDDLVGDVLDALRQAGELEETYVVFTSDNGYFLGEHRLLQKGHLYEEAVRVPLVIRGPGLPSGATRRQPVANIDLAPTIARLAGAPELVPADGIDLVPLIRDPDLAPSRDLLLESRTAAGVRAPGWLYVEHDYEGDGTADEFELYELDADPRQLANLIALRDATPRADLSRGERTRVAAQRSRLAERLEALRNCQAASCR